ncbi:hypothetical protein C1X50_32660, partial [Pseudomonas sp. MPR-TSA4]|uniref:hypothetical protein n=1 Tax=Pseudomonas sp. MPR-TSA4 TaxID=2070594 RepID=UPI000CB5DB75
YERAIALYTTLLGAGAPRVQSLESALIANEWIHGNVDGLMPRIDRLLARIGTDPKTTDAKNARLGQLNAQTVTATNLGDLDRADASA